MRGGNVAQGVEFVDVSNEDGIKKVNWGQNAPPWLKASRGLCLEGKCTNRSCQANGEKVIMPMGYITFDIVLDTNESTTKCPMCSKYVEPESCAFNNCWWKWSGVKQTKKGEPPIRCSMQWQYAGDAYYYFDKHKSGTIIWRQLILEAVEDQP